MVHHDQTERDALLDTWAALLDAPARLGRVLERELSATECVPLSTAEVLLRLLAQPTHALPTTELARSVSFTSGGFTKFVDRLVGIGLVERRADPADRRVVRIALTDEGVASARAAADTLVSGLRRHLLEPLGPRRVTSLKEALRELASALELTDVEAGRR